MFNTDFCKNRMREIGMTQVMLADKLGMSSQHVSNVINNNRKPSIKLIRDMAEILGVRSKDLWDYEDKFYKMPLNIKDEPKVIANKKEIVLEALKTSEKNEAQKDGVWLDKEETAIVYASLVRFIVENVIEMVDDDVSDVEIIDWLRTALTIYAKVE